MNNLTASEIFEKHFKAFQNEEFNIFTPSPKFKTKEEVAEALQSGIVIPALWNICSEKCLSVYNQLVLNSLLDFASLGARGHFKSNFSSALSQLNIY